MEKMFFFQSFNSYFDDIGHFRNDADAIKTIYDNSAEYFLPLTENFSKFLLTILQYFGSDRNVQFLFSDGCNTSLKFLIL